MESLPRQPDAEAKRRSQIIEHAGLAAQYAETPSDDIHEQLTAIEERLGMTREEIAQAALSIYKASYRP